LWVLLIVACCEAGERGTFRERVSDVVTGKGIECEYVEWCELAWFM
jgi:hypothetical protein